MLKTSMRLLLFTIVAAALCLQAETVTIQVLDTTDLHGNLMPYDYFTAKPANRGLAKIATLVREARKQNPNTLLIDTGDTIQGASLETVHQSHALEKGAPPDPMMLAMNTLGYDAMVVGNHEFNYGLKNQNKAREAAKFPWISANIDAKEKPFEPWIVKTIAGVKIAVVGITTPNIPDWEKPENYKGDTFRQGVEAAQEAVDKVRAQAKPDIVVIGAHSGLERDLKTGAELTGNLPGEDVVYAMATKVKGVDAIFFGHSHQMLEGTMIGQTLVIQPKNWGSSLAQVEFTLEREGSGPWKITRKQGKLIPVTESTATDTEIARIGQPYHERTEAFLNRPVSTTKVPLSAATSRVQDSALIDAIQQVQLNYAKADVSLTSAFNTRLNVPAGPITVRQIAALYVYDNELFAVEANGKMLREALENATRYFKSCSDASCTNSPLLNRSFMGYNFDMAQGVTYDIDLTQPEGKRIVNLMYKGKPLADDQPLRLAVNNYRAAGSGGYTMLKSAKMVWRSYDTIRDLIVRYYSEGHALPEKPDNNWRILPEAARSALQKEITADVQRTSAM